MIIVSVQIPHFKTWLLLGGLVVGQGDCDLVSGLTLITRWLSLNYNITALSLSSDSTRLLVCLANRIQELELLDSR